MNDFDEMAAFEAPPYQSRLWLRAANPILDGLNPAQRPR